jgi:hypothetical protein
MGSSRVRLALSLALLAGWASQLAGEETDFATALMTSTIKIEGEGSTGTGFLLEQPHGGDSARAACILVTTAHVLAQLPGETVTLHLRRRSGERFERLPVPLRVRRAGRPLWVQHPVADVAVMPVALPAEAHVVLTGCDRLATDETLAELAIGPGEEVLVLGFPFGAESSAAGFPILRGGRIASYPLLPTRDLRTFLMDFPVFTGNSGGPVFITSASRRRGASLDGKGFGWVLGLVSRLRQVRERRTSLDETVMTHSLSLAVVVHASFVREVIESLPPLED